MSDSAALSAFLDRAKWVLRVFAGLWKQRYSGDVTFHFHEGNLSRDFHRQIKDRAPE